MLVVLLKLEMNVLQHAVVYLILIGQSRHTEVKYLAEKLAAGRMAEIFACNLFSPTVQLKQCIACQNINIASAMKLQQMAEFGRILAY